MGSTKRRVGLSIPKDIEEDVLRELEALGEEPNRNTFNRVLIARYRQLLRETAQQQKLIDRLLEVGRQLPPEQPAAGSGDAANGEEWNSKVW